MKEFIFKNLKLIGIFVLGSLCGNLIITVVTGQPVSTGVYAAQALIIGGLLFGLISGDLIKNSKK